MLQLSRAKPGNPASRLQGNNNLDTHGIPPLSQNVTWQRAGTYTFRMLYQNMNVRRWNE